MHPVTIFSLWTKSVFAQLNFKDFLKDKYDFKKRYININSNVKLDNQKIANSIIFQHSDVAMKGIAQAATRLQQN